MKYIYTIAITCLLHVACTNKIYIVRHAEKSTEPKNDPNLTEVGTQRASSLATLLTGKKITSIYSTNTNRTKQTATPLSTTINVPIVVYKNDTMKRVLQNIFIAKKNTLIVGHSNTILPMLDSMQINHLKKEVPDWEYDNMFVVVVKKYCKECTQPFKVKKVYYKKYGATSVATANALRMPY